MGHKKAEPISLVVGHMAHRLTLQLLLEWENWPQKVDTGKEEKRKVSLKNENEGEKELMHLLPVLGVGVGAGWVGFDSSTTSAPSRNAAYLAGRMSSGSSQLRVGACCLGKTMSSLGSMVA